MNNYAKVRPFIWLITGDLPPRFSGPGLNDMILAPQLVEQGFDVALVTFRHKGDRRRDSFEGCTVIRTGPPAQSLINKAYLPVSRTMTLLREQRRPDLIRFRGLSLSTALFARVARMLFPEIKLVMQPAQVGADDPDSLLSKPFGRFQVNALRHADAVFAMNPIIEDAVRRSGYPQQWIFSVRNPVDLDRYSPAAAQERRRIRARLGIAERSVCVVTLGLISPRKRQAFITRALRDLPARASRPLVLMHVGPDAAQLAGAGKPVQSAQATLEEKEISAAGAGAATGFDLRLTGFQTAPEQYLKAADIFVMASAQEGEPNVVNEAQAVGLPLVLPDSAIYRNLAADGAAEFFEPGSEESLARAVERFIDDRGSCTAAGEKARRHIEATRTPAAVASALAENLRKVLKA